MISEAWVHACQELMLLLWMLITNLNIYVVDWEEEIKVLVLFLLVCYRILSKSLLSLNFFIRKLKGMAYLSDS